MSSSPSPQAVRAKRLAVVLILFSLIALYLILFIFRLQIFDYGFYQEKVFEQITVGSSLPAERGKIYERNGVVLAENKTVWRIYLSPVDIAKKTKRKKCDYAAVIADGLADILGLDRDAIYQKASKSGVLDQTVYRNADEETTRKVLLFAKENGLSSMIHTEAGTARHYPYGSLAAHALGFTGNDNQGLFGLESYYNSVLTGTDGQYLAAVDSQGVKLPSAYTDYTEASNGLSVVTTLDLYMQKELEHQLEQALLATGAQNRVTGIVMQVKTGDILAIPTAPSFNLNDPYRLDTDSLEKLCALGLEQDSAEYKSQKNELLYKMWSNKAVSELYEPGSTFKIITVSAALETKAVTKDSTFYCPGYYVVGGCRIRCHKHGGHGSLTLTQGLQQSCNPVMMQSAERMGKDAFYNYFTAFGYTEKTGIDLPGEALGISHSLSSLGSTELATSSFGQRFKVTAVSQLCAIAAVANGGTLVTPHLLSSLTSEDGKMVFQYQTNEKRQVISKETAALVATILEGGVSGDGGAKNAYTDGYAIAAKTGTSEKFE
ncbi:MAG: stage V sporulation protein D, partial [Clostridia bacterium]|nr:stage V sporulation protein D [Clostridia bacterium]